MTKKLAPADLPAAKLATKAALRKLGLEPEYPGAPFSKRDEGRDRRQQRRAKEARRMAWLNS